jgi:crotonobetainyl-CoA:carnitine CoA-transferase CaiB-like acyl-CoA transferase
MSAPLDGIRVVEVANWLAAPAATRLMADLGADVIKVEPPGGDMFRNFQLRSLGYDYDFAGNAAFELDNFGKRSITVDLEKPGGPDVVKKLAANCDVFLTNLIRRRRERFGLTWDDVSAANPNVIYASFSGYGTEGPDQDRSGFDYAAFWARSGIMSLLGEPDAPPPLCRGGQGDHATALNILSAVLAALRQRDKTGEPQHVEVTLQGTGMWTIAGDFSAALVARQHPPRISRKKPTHPVWNSYECADGKWLLLVNPTPFPNTWRRFAEILGHTEWAAEYDDMAKLVAASAELTARIDPIMKTQNLAHWATELDRQSIIWAPVASMTDVINDPQVRQMGWITEAQTSFGPLETLDTPFKLRGSDTGVRGPAPTPGEHTFDVLAEFGIEGDELNQLATDGVFG